MTAGVVGLVAAYVALAALLLSLNLRARWRWPVKAAAILVTGGFFVGSFPALQAMLGRPTEQAPSASFRLHAALVEEPDPRQGEPGAIYLWLSEADRAGAYGRPPRAHALPYTRAMHEAVAKAQQRLDEGREVRGRRRADARDEGGHRAPDFELYTVEGHGLPPKPGADPAG